MIRGLKELSLKKQKENINQEEVNRMQTDLIVHLNEINSRALAKMLVIKQRGSSSKKEISEIVDILMGKVDKEFVSKKEFGTNQ